MLHINNIRTNPEKLTSDLALTIGNFDGCHLGHQNLLEMVIDAAQQRSLLAGVMTFFPAPDEYFKGKPLSGSRLFAPDQKIRAMKELGLDLTVVEPFDFELAQMDRQDFFLKYIVERLRAKELVVGYDFKFGKDRKGNAAYLARACHEAGIKFSEGQRVLHDDLPISSTRIREGLSRGDIAETNKMLGRPYMIEGTVRQGDQIGRNLGFPTANLKGCSQLLPRIGVYAGMVTFDHAPPVMKLPSKFQSAVINIGTRPTISDAQNIQVEAHCFEAGFSQELYNQPIAIYFIHRLRDEKKFESLEELKSAIAFDIQSAKAILRNI